MLIPSIINPESKNKATKNNGNFGRSFKIKRRCGWKNTKRIQKTAKYTIYGVKIDNNIAIANTNE